MDINFGTPIYGYQYGGPIVANQWSFATSIVILITVLIIMGGVVWLSIRTKVPEQVKVPSPPVKPAPVYGNEKFADYSPDAKLNVNYHYEEPVSKFIRGDPGENILFSTAHANVMEDYPSVI